MIVDRKKFLMCVSVALSLILYIYKKKEPTKKYKSTAEMLGDISAG